MVYVQWQGRGGVLTKVHARNPYALRSTLCGRPYPHHARVLSDTNAKANFAPGAVCGKCFDV